jgi:hypothetical protein
MHWAAISGEQPHSMCSRLARFIVFRIQLGLPDLDVAKHLELARKVDRACSPPPPT